MSGFHMSGPEEGDVIDQSVQVCDDDGTEILTITKGSLRKRKSIGRQVARLLNEGLAEVMK